MIPILMHAFCAISRHSRTDCTEFPGSKCHIIITDFKSSLTPKFGNSIWNNLRKALSRYRNHQKLHRMLLRDSKTNYWSKPDLSEQNMRTYSTMIYQIRVKLPCCSSAMRARKLYTWSAMRPKSYHCSDIIRAAETSEGKLISWWDLNSGCRSLYGQSHCSARLPVIARSLGE